MKLRRLISIPGLILTLAWAQTAALGQETVEPTPEGTTTESIGGSGDNVAVAISTKDGSSRFKVSFRIVRTSSDVVDQSNIAFAFASCEQCQSVAIAFQVVLVSGSPSILIPENYAIALNFECTDCETLASAYQFVLGVDGNVHFSAEGNRALSEIRRAVQSLASSDLAIEDIQAELDLLAADLRQVLADELVSKAPDLQVEEVHAEEGSIPAETPTPTADPSPSPAEESTSEPFPSTTPQDSGTPGESPSPSPSSSPSPAPTPTVSASV